MRPITIAVLSLILAAPAAAQVAGHAEAHGDEDEHVAEAHGLRVTHAWTRATGGDEALVFFELENEGEATVTVTGATSSVGAAGSLAGFRLVDGAPGLMPVPSLPVEAGAEVDFTPVGLGVLLTGLAAPLVEGGSFVLELETSAGPVPITVLVEDADATQHSHAGHAH